MNRAVSLYFGNVKVKCLIRNYCKSRQRIHGETGEGETDLGFRSVCLWRGYSDKVYLYWNAEKRSTTPGFVFKAFQIACGTKNMVRSRNINSSVEISSIKLSGSKKYSTSVIMWRYHIEQIGRSFNVQCSRNLTLIVDKNIDYDSGCNGMQFSCG